MNGARVSVIMPAYNAAATIVRAIDSVLRQRPRVHEIIVVDDGSTDDTAALVRSRYPKEVRLLAQQNGGPAAARNRAIQQAEGDYLAFLDADDEWLDGKIGMQLAAFRERPGAGLCFTDMSHCEAGALVHLSYLHEKGYRYAGGGEIYNNLLQGCFIFTPTVMVPREVLEVVGLFDEGLRISEDYDLWLRIAERYLVLFVDLPLLKRHRNGANLTENLLLYAESSALMLERLLARHRSDPARVGILRRRLAEVHRNAGYQGRLCGASGSSRAHYLKSLYYRPSFPALKGLLLGVMPSGAARVVRSFGGTPPVIK